MKRFIFPLIVIVALPASVWQLARYAEQQANRLELEGTANKPLVPDRIVNGVRVFDDIPEPEVELVPNPGGPHLPQILSPIDPVQKEQLRQAAIYRNFCNAAYQVWWLTPLPVMFLLVLSAVRRSRLKRMMEQLEREKAAKEVADAPVPPT